MSDPDLNLLRHLLDQRDREIVELRVANEALREVARRKSQLLIQAQELIELAIEQACDGDRRAVLRASL